MSIKIREILPADNQTIASVIRGALKEHKVDQPGTVYTDPTTDKLYELFQTEGSIYYIALDGNEIIGGCGLYPTEGLPFGCVELVKFYLMQNYRGKGIGKLLMQKCMEVATTMGYTQLYLESLPELATAVGMYENLGFKHIPEPLGNSGHFACTILMTKDL